MTETFITKLEASEFGLEIRFAGSYYAAVTPDDEQGGYFITYRNGEMPPHTTGHAYNAVDAAAQLRQVVDLSQAVEIEAE
jgi:hypothetical protein